MAKLETRLPCPVCAGLKMEKAKLGRGDRRLVLDHCQRCGGVWFELGEVQRLRAQGSDLLWRAVQRRDYQPVAQCHACHAHMSRSLTKCPACDHDNQLDCPNCLKPMQVASEHGLTLDVCRDCKGVWFDHAELEAIWKVELSRALSQRGNAVEPALAGDDLMLAAVLYSPDLMFVGAHVAGQAIGAAGQVLSNAPGLLASAGEVVAEAAGSVFEAIVAILEGFG